MSAPTGSEFEPTLVAITAMIMPLMNIFWSVMKPGISCEEELIAVFSTYE